MKAAAATKEPSSSRKAPESLDFGRMPITGLSEENQPPSLELGSLETTFLRIYGSAPIRAQPGAVLQSLSDEARAQNPHSSIWPRSGPLFQEMEASNPRLKKEYKMASRRLEAANDGAERCLKHSSSFGIAVLPRKHFPPNAQRIHACMHE